MSRQQEEKNQKLLSAIRARPENKKCMDCTATLTQYVVMDYGTWVCATCSGIHREFNHKIKSPTMGTFTTDEVKKLDKGGNDVAKAVWRARWNSREFNEPGPGEVWKIRDFIAFTYRDKKWYSASSDDSRDLKDSRDYSNRSENRLSNPPITSISSSSSSSYTQPKPPSKSASLIDWDDIPNDPSPAPAQGFQNTGFPPHSAHVTNQPAPSDFNPFSGYQSQPTQPMQAQPMQAQPMQGQFNPFLSGPSSQPQSQPMMGQPFNMFDQPAMQPAVQQTWGQNPFPSTMVVPHSQTSQPSVYHNQPPKADLNPFDFDPIAPKPANDISQAFSGLSVSQPTQPGPSTGDLLGMSSQPSRPAQPVQSNSTRKPALSDKAATDVLANLFALQPPPARILTKPTPAPDPKPATHKRTPSINERPPAPKVESHAPECPICAKRFSTSASNDEINRHIDECLNKPQLYEERGADRFASAAPSNNWDQLFDLSKMDWYYGSIDRREAEKTDCCRILMKCKEDSFMVRKSSVPNSYALSLFNHKKQSITHTLIEPRDGGYAFQDSSRIYRNILDLIERSPECGNLRPPPKGNLNQVLMDL